MAYGRTVACEARVVRPRFGYGKRSLTATVEGFAWWQRYFQLILKELPDGFGPAAIACFGGLVPRGTKCYGGVVADVMCAEDALCYPLELVKNDEEGCCERKWYSVLLDFGSVDESVDVESLVRGCQRVFGVEVILRPVGSGDDVIVGEDCEEAEDDEFIFRYVLAKQEKIASGSSMELIFGEPLVEVICVDGFD